jgi:hypothetical protein
MSLCKCLHFVFPTYVYICGEHKTRVVQVNSKNHNLKRLLFFNLIKLDPPLFEYWSSGS